MSRRDRDNARLKKQMLLKLQLQEALKKEPPTKSYSLEESLSIINKNRPLEFMVHGRWQTYSHYEVTLPMDDYTTIWFIDSQTGGQIPARLHQIERWRKDGASDELKAAIASLKDLK